MVTFEQFEEKKQKTKYLIHQEARPKDWHSKKQMFCESLAHIHTAQPHHYRMSSLEKVFFSEKPQQWTCQSWELLFRVLEISTKRTQNNNHKKSLLISKCKARIHLHAVSNCCFFKSMQKNTWRILNICFYIDILEWIYFVKHITWFAGLKKTSNPNSFLFSCDLFHPLEWKLYFLITWM